MDQHKIDQINWTGTSQLSRAKLKQLSGFTLITKNDLSRNVDYSTEIVIRHEFPSPMERCKRCCCERDGNGRKCFDESCPKRRSYVTCPPSCGEGCANNPFARDAFKKKMRLVHRWGRGFGVITNEKIEEGDMIMEYIGQIFHVDANPVGDSSIYACDLGSTDLTPKRHQLVVEPTFKGGWARFFAHSHNPTCKMDTFYNDGKLHNLLIAIKTIEPGTEICWDYGINFRNMGIKICYCFFEGDGKLKPCPDLGIATKKREEFLRDTLVLQARVSSILTTVGKSRKSVSINQPIPGSTISSIDNIQAGNRQRASHSTTNGISTPPLSPVSSLPIDNDESLSANETQTDNVESFNDDPQAVVTSVINTPINLIPEEKKVLLASRPTVKPRLLPASSSNLINRTGKKGRKKTPLRDMLCRICSKQFHRKGHFNDHMRQVHGQGPKLQCPHAGCSKKCTSTKLLKSHLESHKPDAKKVKFRCPSCSELFSRRNIVRNHQSRSNGKCRIEKGVRVEPGMHNVV